MRENPLAILVTMGESGMIASHVPMLHYAEPPPHGVFRCHMAKSNPQWSQLSPEIEALIIFNGPDHYISPSWYPSKAAHGKVVPTWNYVTVHAYGSIKVIEDRDWLLQHLNELTNVNETALGFSWRINDAPKSYIDALLGMIVGFEISVTRLEGKFKISQNRSQSDITGVVHGLQDIGTSAADQMARLVGGPPPEA
jgi:transcriptional regulator